MNGQKHFKLLFKRLNFQPRLFNSRQLCLFLGLSLQFPQSALRFTLLPPLRSLHRSNCCLVAHEDEIENMPN